MAHRRRVGIRGANPDRKKKHKRCKKRMSLQKVYDKLFAQNCGMDLQWCDDGFSLEKLYELAGKEDRVLTITLRHESPSEQIWGNSITCCIIYTERERLHLLENLKNDVSTFGKVRAKYLLSEFTNEQIDRLKSEGFDSQDAIEILIAPQLTPSNVYGSEEKRELNTIEIPLAPEPPLEELKFQFYGLCRFLEDGMILTPSEHVDFLALKLIFNMKLTDDEKLEVYDGEGKIHNNEVARSYLLFRSRMTTLSEEKKAAQTKLESIRLQERCAYIDSELKKMGSSVEKLKIANVKVCGHILYNVIRFHERRLNVTGHYPIYLDLKGYVHIGLRHIKEWQFCDYFAERDKFQLNESDVITTLQNVVDVINDDYQAKKEVRPDYLYRKYGRDCIYLYGDYYMIHIAADGRIENFSKVVDKKAMEQS